MNRKHNYILLIIGVISLGLLLTGGTYAWLVYEGVTIGENKLTGNTTNFVIDYESSLTGVLLPSVSDKGGLHGTITAKINDNSAVSSATGSLYLYADSNTSSILYEGTEELGHALKYSVYHDNELITDGYVDSDITNTGTPNGMLIYGGIKINDTTPVVFDVYLWLDGNYVDNRYLNVKFSGSLNLKAVQDDIS